MSRETRSAKKEPAIAQSSKTASLAGLILSGGASERMGRDKPFALLLDKPLLAHVIQRFAPQVPLLAISAYDRPERFAIFGLPVVSDAAGARCGPLGGLLAGLEFAQSCGCDALAAAPCDAPFLPRDLVSRLEAARAADGAAAARGPRGVEPLFSIWPVKARTLLREALASARLSVFAALEALDAQFVDFSAVGGNPFANLNSPSELEAARKQLAQTEPCSHRDGARGPSGP